MNSFEVTTLKDGNQNPYIVDYVKNVFEKALRRNCNYEDVEMFLAKKLEIKSYTTTLEEGEIRVSSRRKVSNKLSSKNNNVGVYLTVVGRHYSLVVNSVEFNAMVWATGKFGDMHIFARYIPRTCPGPLLYATAKRIADLLYMNDEDVDKLDELPKPMKNIVKEYL